MIFQSFSVDILMSQSAGRLIKNAAVDVNIWAILIVMLARERERKKNGKHSLFCGGKVCMVGFFSRLFEGVAAI